MKTVFVRLIEAEDKGRELRLAIQGERTDGIFSADASSFLLVPGSPFCYWVSDEVRQLFDKLPPLSSDGREAFLGASSKDDFRYLRLTWEVAFKTADSKTGRGGKWVDYAKGGEYSPFYGDIHLSINWASDAAEIDADVVAKYPYLKGDAEWVLHRSNPYFSPGLTWPARTQKGFSLRALPAGCVFGNKGPSLFAQGEEWGLLSLLALGNSTPFKTLLECQLAFGSYEVGVIRRAVVPRADARGIAQLSELAKEGWRVMARGADFDMTERLFLSPALLSEGRARTLRGMGQQVVRVAEDRDRRITQIQDAIDGVAFELYGWPEEDRGSSSPQEPAWHAARTDLAELTRSLLEWTVGVTFGHFDIRLATGERPIPEPPDPFDPLPVCSPGMLQDEDGLPATTSPPGYPIEVAWDGILVDDEGHPRDIVRHIRRVLSEVSDAQDWTAEAEEILGRDLRSWVQRSLFEDHIKRYSKSRRKAPIFWRLGTPSGSYSVWLYYPRATGDTLYRVLNDYVEPKLRHEESALLRLRQDAGASPTASQQKRIEAQETLVSEVQGMKGELEVIAQLWRPEFDDGVVLNFAPFWRLVAHTRKWQKQCQKHWKRLREGEYDWSYTAMRLWPERVVPACAEDRSFAMAHGLEEEFFPEKAEGDDGRASKVRENERIQKLVDARSSAAVKQALQTLLER